MPIRPKLPRSVIILNIIMVVLILVICGLAVSLVNDTVKAEREKTTTTLWCESEEVSDVVPDGESASDTSAATTTTTRVSVSMTKRTTEPTEPVDVPNDIPEVTTPAPVNSGKYTRSFFAEDLFIGDSISTGLYQYDKLDMKNVAAGIGLTPYKAYSNAIDLYDGSSMTALEYAKTMQPKRIFVMLGSNGMASDSDVEAMKKSYKTLLEKLCDACPQSKVYCISVTPVTADSSAVAASGNYITNKIIMEFNSYVESLCKELGLRYFDLYSKLVDDSGNFSKEYAEVDGMHFLGKTYDVMLSFLENELKGE